MKPASSAKPSITIRFGHFAREQLAYLPMIKRMIESCGVHAVVDNQTLKPDLFLGSIWYGRGKNVPFAPNLDHFQCRKVLWTEEPERICDLYQVPYDQYDVCIGPQRARDGFVSVPNWVLNCIDWFKPRLEFDGLLNTPELLCRREKFSFPKTKHIAFIARAGCKFRTRIVGEILKRVHVDCPGRIHHNCAPGILSARFSRNQWASKLEFLKPYAFNVSIENTRDRFYSSEKIMHSLMVKSVPIYLKENGPSGINEDAVHFYPERPQRSDLFFQPLTDPEFAAQKSNAPVFESPDQIREMYGPKRIGEIILG